MGFCYKGIADITFKDKADEDRFNEIKGWTKGNDDAAYELLLREKSGEAISSDSVLFDSDSKIKEATLEPFSITTDKDTERLKGVVDKQIASLNARIADLRKSVNSLKGVDKSDRQASIDKLEDLLEELTTLETKEQFIAIVEYTRAEMTRIEEWLKGGEKGFDPTKEIHRDTLLAINRQLDTYQGLNVPQFATKHSQLQSNILDINTKYQNIKEEVKENVMDVLMKMFEQYSDNPRYKDKEALIEYLKESNDIDGLQALFIDLDTSTDSLLGIVGKIYAEKRQEVSDLVGEFKDKAFAAGKKLLDAGIDNQDFMVDKSTGNIITRLSTGWREALSNVLSKTDSLEVGDNGMKIKRKYIQGTNLSDDEKKHNLELAADKREIGEFLRSEYWDKDKKALVDGVNKKYTDIFKQEREKHEVYEKAEYLQDEETGVFERVTDGGWVKRDDVSDEVYAKYLKRYYNPTTTGYRLVKDDKGEPTGEVEEFQIRHVKETFQEVREQWNSKEYEAIQANPAQKEFYDFYVQAYQELLDKLPADIAKRMDGRVLRIRDSFVDELVTKKTSIIKQIMKKLKQMILPDIITNGRVLDEQGFPVNDVGIFYVGDLKSDKRIAQLEAEMETIKSSQDPADKKRYAKLKNSLLIEQNKLRPEELKYDLVESLIQGMAMAENYDVMKSVESTFLIAQEHLHGKKFFKGLDKFGEPLKDAKGNIEYKNEESKAEKRLDTWMRMIFYNNSEANNSTVAQLALLGKRMTSVALQGFNVFSGVNNIVTAEMNQVIEGFGGRFYTTKDYKAASDEMARHLADGKWMTHMFKQPDKYTKEKPYNKLTAMVEHFNFLEAHSDSGDGIKQNMTAKEYAKSFNWMYALIEGGEYQAQVRSAIAKMIATKIVLEDGTETNVYDAHDFNEVTGELTLKEGVKFSAKDKYKATNEIRNMNKFIHGNYSTNDKVAIQENWYGELAYQFKKWIPNAVRSRFSGMYYDESTSMYQEGRYLAAKQMFQNIHDVSFAGIGEAYKGLTDLQQANMRKNAAEAGMYATAIALYIIFDAIREGVPPEDEKTRMALNFLKKQADRSRGEIDFFLNPLQWYNQAKNPMASFTILKESGEFMGAVAGVPFYGIQGKTDKWRYQKGINKGDLKVYKEGRDLVPGLRTLSQWDQLDITGNFFIK